MQRNDNPSCRARLNPFAAHHVEKIPFRFFKGTWESNLARLAAHGFRAAIVGPHGSGKTTLLLELRDRILRPAAGECSPELPQRCRLVCIARRPGEIEDQLEAVVQHTEPPVCWLVDGFERLGWWQKWRLLDATRRGAGLVVTAHRRGLLPVWVRTRTDPGLLKHVLGQLPVESTPALLQQASVALARHRGNLREVLRTLYDQNPPELRAGKGG